MGNGIALRKMHIRNRKKTTGSHWALSKKRVQHHSKLRAIQRHRKQPVFGKGTEIKSRI